MDCNILSAEICLSPHMDNLVNIYRRMKMEDSINLFVSEPSPTLAIDSFGKSAI